MYRVKEKGDKTMFDCHIHTCFSADSKMTIEEVRDKCQKEGIGVILTEHMDLDFPGELIFEYDIKHYFDTYSPYRGDKLLLGIEIGMQPHVRKVNGLLIASHPFDFVLASTHVVDGMDLCDMAYYKNKTQEEAYRRYFQVMYTNLAALENFDSVGHLDYISRYSPYETPEIGYKHYKEEIDQVLRLIAVRGKALEINTKRFKVPGVVANYGEILLAYKRLGGRYVTIGSDAHQDAFIGMDFDLAYGVAQEVGLQVVYYKERQLHVLQKED